MTDPDQITYCVEGDGKPTVGERLVGLTSGGDEIVELVCYEHLHAGDPDGAT